MTERTRSLPIGRDLSGSSPTVTRRTLATWGNGHHFAFSPAFGLAFGLAFGPDIRADRSDSPFSVIGLSDLDRSLTFGS